MDPSTRYAALAFSTDSNAQTPGPAAYLRVQRHLLATVAPRTPGRVLIGNIDGFPLLLVPARTGLTSLESRVLASLQAGAGLPDTLVGIGSTAVALPESGAACQEARDALTVGRRSGWTNRTVCFRDVAAEVLLIRNPDVAAVLRERLAPLRGKPELRQTLAAYLENGLSARATARTLYIHYNTVSYRLKQIEHALNLRLSDFASRPDLMFALRADQLSSDATDETPQQMR